MNELARIFLISKLIYRLMRHKVLIGAGLLTCACMAWAAKDPTIMTVGNIQVPLSEFEYLYHKNAQQQLQAQPLDEYVELFKLYKMKVADAAEEGIDTTTKFVREMNQYRDELAKPYLTDSVFLENLAKETYERMKQEYDVKHIMRLKKPNRQLNQRSVMLLDSLRQVIAKGGDFAALAEQYSEDTGSASQGGDMGYMVGGMVPYDFETAMINTPKGSISKVVESPMAYHIVYGSDKRPFQGYVKASHILRMVPQDATPEQEAAIKISIDSIYNAVKADPSKFEELARALSDDKGSGSRGGALGAFTVGQMVKPFSDAAFALKDGEISEPVRSQFGYHVIYRTGCDSLNPYDKIRGRLITRVSHPQDDRVKLINDNMRLKLAKHFNVRNNPQGLNSFRKAAKEGVDSIFFANLQTMREMPLYKTNIKNITIGDYLDSGYKPSAIAPDPQIAAQNSLDEFMLYTLENFEKDRLEKEVPEYRNLLKEYRDGSMLYEVSLQKVWDKASKDTEGQEQYFAAHRGDFKWNEPRVKGLLVKVVNDSVAQLVRNRLSELTAEEAVTGIRSEFGRKVQIDKVLVKKGDNALVDYLVEHPDGDQAPAPANYPVCFLFNALTLSQPSEFEDVKGMVTSAYQDQLEQDWINSLKAKYPVKVDKKVLKQVK